MMVYPLLMTDNADQLQKVGIELVRMSKEGSMLAACPACKMPFIPSKIKSYKCDTCSYQMKFDQILWINRQVFAKA
jgi:hypothetical protein